jgi:hypothetical protein
MSLFHVVLKSRSIQHIPGHDISAWMMFDCPFHPLTGSKLSPMSMEWNFDEMTINLSNYQESKHLHWRVGGLPADGYSSGSSI